MLASFLQYLLTEERSYLYLTYYLYQHAARCNVQTNRYMYWVQLPYTTFRMNRGFGASPSYEYHVLAHVGLM